MFIVFPVWGGIVGGLVYRYVFERPASEGGKTAEQAQVEAATSRARSRVVSF